MKRLKKILIVDDDEVSNFVSAQIIKAISSGFEIRTVLNGLEAMEYFKTHPENLPEYVLLDVNMPMMNGIDFLCWLDSSDYHGRSKVILYTNSLFHQELNKANPFTDVVAHIEKPISPLGVRDLFLA